MSLEPGAGWDHQKDLSRSRKRFPWWLRLKVKNPPPGIEPTCNAGDLGSIPGLGRSPRRGHGNPLQYSCLENPYGQRSLVGSSPWGPKHWTQLSDEAQRPLGWKGYDCCTENWAGIANFGFAHPMWIILLFYQKLASNSTFSIFLALLKLCSLLVMDPYQ